MMRALIAAVLIVVGAGSASAQGQRTASSPHGDFAAPCAQCHRADSWKPVAVSKEFKHPSRFPLQAAHTKVSCTTCHTRLDFTGTKPNCASCHRDVHQGELGANCATCHTQRSFVDVAQLRQRHQTTRFPLTGGHAAADCRSCHTPRAPGQQAFVNVSTSCVSCHVNDYRAAATPPHAASGFPTDCTTCHSVTAWRGAPFDHATTQFPLTGAHRAANCQSCHGDKVYRGKPTACASCHQTQFAATKSPPHAAAGFPTTCQTCHTTTAWTGAPFDHATTQFPLTGAHRALDCRGCHGDGVYKGKPSTCVSCHQSAYDKTTKIPHAAAGFPATCETCHSTTSWVGAPFDHATTAFPLTGAHRALDCRGCHGDGVYKGKPSTCVSCHQATYDRTKTPPHAAAGFSTNCQTCHNTTTWPGAVFDHAATQFPLVGAHKAANCSQCHADGVYRGKPTTCVSCHQTTFAATTKPAHAASGFPTTCETCHSQTAWLPASFDHATTRFPLAGAHRAVNCSQCHGDGVYRGKPSTCVSCHQTKYTATTNPPHGAAGFPTTCETCHSQAAWTPATFNHGATNFPLTGAHITTSCVRCHGDGVYRGKPTTCVSCHQANYTATTNPNHQAAGFPTDCASCHTTTRWLGAVFDHDAREFPIYSGAHRGIWGSCATCHTNPSNYAVFNCLGCHTKTKADNDHKDKPGYVYASPNCYACHPRGKAS